MIDTPVERSPLITARWMGDAPLYRGSSDADVDEAEPRQGEEFVRQYPAYAPPQHPDQAHTREASPAAPAL